MLRKKGHFEIVAAIAVSVLALVSGGCGSEEAPKPHHTVDDVVAALESAGHEIELRMTTDKDVGERVREETLAEIPAEDWEGLAIKKGSVGVFVFDLQADDGQQKIDNAIEEGEEYDQVLVQLDNLVLDLTDYPASEVLVEDLQEELSNR
ncbi:MAG: hypothetical protein ACLFWL_12350 [Candidatus Brocadiia bacterium]